MHSSPASRSSPIPRLVDRLLGLPAAIRPTALRELPAALLPAIEQEVARRERLPKGPPLVRADGSRISLRAFAEDAAYLGLTYSPLMAAVADASEGMRPTTIDDALALKHFGCRLDDLPRVRRPAVVIRAGGRSGKTSRLLAVAALHAALTVPLPTLAPGEHAVALLVSSELIFAHQALSYVRGYVEGSPTLAALLVGEPGAEKLSLRRAHDGATVDVRVRAAGKGGKGGRSATLVFAGLDEACFFDSEGAAVSDVEIHRAVEQRLVPGAQCWIASTPWAEGVGLLEELQASDWGVHRHALCVRAGTRALNPTWDPDHTIEGPMRERDPENALREIDAIPLTTGVSTYFAKDAIEASVNADRPLQLPPDPAAVYFAGGDFGFKRNSSTLAVVALTDKAVRLASLLERKPAPGAPLKPSEVAAEFAVELLRYGVREVACDSHEREEVEQELSQYGISVVPLPGGQLGKVVQYRAARTVLHEGRCELPSHTRLVGQLKAVKSKPLPGGGLSITSPQSLTGEHGDLASAFVAALWRATASPVLDEDLDDPVAVPRART